MSAVAAVLAILNRSSWFCFAAVLRDVRRKRAGPIKNDGVRSCDPHLRFLSEPVAECWSFRITVGPGSQNHAGSRPVGVPSTYPIPPCESFDG